MTCLYDLRVALTNATCASLAVCHQRVALSPATCELLCHWLPACRFAAGFLRVTLPLVSTICVSISHTLHRYCISINLLGRQGSPGHASNAPAQAAIRHIPEVVVDPILPTPQTHPIPAHLIHASPHPTHHHPLPAHPNLPHPTLPCPPTPIPQPIPAHHNPPQPVPSHPNPSQLIPTQPIPSHPIPSHPIPSHLKPSHFITSHPMTSHSIPSHPIPSHPIPHYPISPLHPTPVSCHMP